MPIHQLIVGHTLAAQRLHGDDTAVRIMMCEWKKARVPAHLRDYRTKPEIAI